MKLTNSIPMHEGLALPIEGISGQVEFRGITFSYPSRPDQV